MVILILYVDNCLLTGDTLAIESAVNDIKKLFNVTVANKVEEYLGCKIDTSRKGEITIHQPHIYKHLETKFEPYLDLKWKAKKPTMTPSTPNFKLTRVKEGEAVLNTIEQTMYRCGVDILLYLVKHTRPDLANDIRELSKAMDIANYLHWKELLRVVVFALKTKEKGLVLKPNNKAKLNLKIYMDAEFAGDADNRRSIIGRVIYLNDTAVGWNSKAMSGVTLSSTESEYVLMSEGMKDLKFLYMCLRYLKRNVELPMLVFIDNIGAIEMLDLKTGKCRTKHVDTRYHWIREFINNDTVKVKYVK